MSNSFFKRNRQNSPKSHWLLGEFLRVWFVRQRGILAFSLRESQEAERVFGKTCIFYADTVSG